MSMTTELGPTGSAKKKFSRLSRTSDRSKLSSVYLLTFAMKSVAVLTLLAVASARLLDNAASKACAADDLKHRTQLQNKLAGVCVDMCKEVGAFPKCTCPDFVAPDSTPGVMTWPELLEHMDNL